MKQGLEQGEAVRKATMPDRRLDPGGDDEDSIEHGMALIYCTPPTVAIRLQQAPKLAAHTDHARTRAPTPPTPWAPPADAVGNAR